MNGHFYVDKGAHLVAPILAFVPFIGLIAVALLAVGASLRPGAGPAVLFLSIVAVVAAVPVLARVTVAPWIVSGSVIVAWIGTSIIEGIAGWRAAAAMGVDGGMSGGSGTGGLVAVLAVAAGVAIWRRSVFTRPPRVDTLLSWARCGLDEYFRDPATGPKRAAIGGGLVAIAALLVGLAMPDAHSGVEPAATGLLLPGAVLVLGAVGTGFLVVTMRIPDESPVMVDDGATATDGHEDRPSGPRPSP